MGALDSIWGTLAAPLEGAPAWAIIALVALVILGSLVLMQILFGAFGFDIRPFCMWGYGFC